MKWLHLLFPAFFASAAFAQEPGIRTALAAEGPFWMGERIVLSVELLSPTWFSGASTFDLPEVPGGILLQVADRPVVSSEEIDGVSYSVQRHAFALFLQREGTCTVPPIPAHFGVAGVGAAKPTEVTLESEAFTAQIQRPPGAEGIAFLVSTTELTVQDRWDREPGEATVGDAFTRRIRRLAPDLPAMAFPPLPPLEVEGLAAYPEPPSVRDRTERGEFTGEREDAVTYVCERAGEITLPALAITWWDTDDEVLRREVLEGVTFTVAPGAEELGAEGTSITGSGTGVSLTWLAALGLLIVAGSIAAWKRVELEALFAKWKEQRDASEAGRFASLRESCRRADAAATLAALYAWLDVALERRRSPTLAALLERSPDPELAVALEALQEAVLGREPLRAPHELERALSRARSVLSRGTRTPAPLPSLNSTDSG